APNFAAVQGFRFLGSDAKIEIFDQLATGVFQPTGTRVLGMSFVEAGSQPLRLPATTKSGEDVALNATPGTFDLLYAHQDGYITGKRAFFFQDDVKTFFVAPEEILIWEWVAQAPNRIAPPILDIPKDVYYKPHRAPPGDP